jgi:putative ABC transport system permease protein
MKTILRNFLSVLRRFKTAAALNIAGLSVAFAAFIVIMAQVHYEWAFDRVHPEAGRIFRADLISGDEAISTHSRALVDALIAFSPHIEAGALMNPFIGQKHVVVGEGDERQGFREPFVTCYPDFARIFGFSFTEGEAGCLDDPEKVIIPQSMARRMFGDEPAAGKAIRAGEYVWTKDGIQTFIVGGVYRDFPGNTQLSNAVYTAIDRTMQGSWQFNNFVCYLLLDDAGAAAGLEAELSERFDFSPVWNPNHNTLSIRLTPLTGIYQAGDAGFYNTVFKVGNPDTVRVLFGIALLIVLIAGINFTNFSIALAPARMKSINTQKILGAPVATLRGALLSEALATAFVSWLAALAVVGMLDRYRALPFIEASLSLPALLPIVLVTGAIALATGLLAGLYPAWYITSFQPAVALKGSFALSPSGRALRTGLVGFQYAVSIGLIVAAGFIQLQNTYMRAFDRGFREDRIAIVELSGNLYNSSKDAYVNRLKAYPGIEDVAFARQKLGTADGYTTYELKFGDYVFHSYVLDVSPNFMQTMGIGITEGRSFLPSDGQPGAGLTFIFNQTLYDELLRAKSLKPGDIVELPAWGNRGIGRTAGITGNVKLTSLRQEADYIAFLVNPRETLPVSFIRLKAGAGIPGAVEHIRQTLAGIDPSYPFDIEFYDDVFHRLYQKEEYLNRAIMLLSLLAIIISVMGVFGLVFFETQHRRKEIGIRKVYGATLGEILAMFNRVYFRIVCICFAVAAPAAWYGVSRWLENFAYRTPLHWWVFALAFAIIALVTLATVTFQSRQAANANPVESIRAE